MTGQPALTGKLLPDARVIGKPLRFSSIMRMSSSLGIYGDWIDGVTAPELDLKSISVGKAATRKRRPSTNLTLFPGALSKHSGCLFDLFIYLIFPFSHSSPFSKPRNVQNGDSILHLH